MAVTRWVFDTGGTNQYTFERNPDRNGGDSYWVYSPRLTEVEIIGASLPSIQVDGFSGAKRTIRFTSISGTMFRTLQDFYFRNQTILNCSDHLTGTTPNFNCYITSFNPNIHPSIGNFPGSGEDTWDLEMTLLRMG
jgi:hypothetical protein